MPWAKFDDQYYDHSKIVEVGPLGMALHTAATCYCARHLTDGFVPTAMLARLINLEGIYIMRNGVSNGVTVALLTDDLVRSGLFESVPGGIMVHDYLEYNPVSEKVKAERAATKQRQQRWRDDHREANGEFNADRNAVTNAVTNGVSNGQNDALVTPTPYPYPYPYPYPIKDGVGGGAFAKIYESEIGSLTPMISDELQELETDYSLEWFAEAVKVSVENNARKLKYVRAVLERWKINGFKAPMVTDKKHPGSNAKETVSQMLDRQLQEIENGK